MPPGFSRRQYLSAAGALSGLSVRSLPGGGTTECDEVEDLRARIDEKEATLAELESEASSLDGRIAELESEIEAARQRYYEQNKTYPEDVRSRAQDTGLAARDRVVTVDWSADGAGGTGTGWFVESDLVLTNSHVIEGAENADDIYGWTVDGTRIDLTYVDRQDDRMPDIGLLRADVTKSPLPNGDSTALEAGEKLICVGHPGGVGNWVISLGEFERRREGHLTDDLVTTVPTLSGSSGSPTLTMDGDVVGVLWGGEFPGSNDDGVPQPADPAPYTELMAVEDEDVLHVPIETALDKVEEWT